MRKILHGEAIISTSIIPAGSKKITKGTMQIIADSETKGNYHCVAVKEGVNIYEYEGTLFVKNDVETEVYCPNETRHDTVTLPIGEWQIDITKEFDYLDNKERRVAD